MAKGISATTATKGNTLSEDEVLRRLEGRLGVPASKEYLGREADNVLAACNRVMDEIRAGTVPPISPEPICALNRLVLDGLPLPAEVVPGEIRTHVVDVGGYRAVPPENCAHLRPAVRAAGRAGPAAS